jgi:hypothetical protein
MQPINDLKIVITDSALSSFFLPEELFDFERVNSSVLRKCFSLSGLNADSYCAPKIKAALPWECDFELGVDWFKSFVAAEGVAAKMEEPLLAFATMLDQRQTSPEVLEAILPKSILKQNALANLLLGRALVRSGLYEEAADVFFQGFLINPTLGPLRRQLGLSLLRMARYEEAALHLEGSLTLRGHIGPQSGSLIAAILVTRPCKDAEVYFYKKYFHAVHRDPKADGPSAIVIGNELYELRKNAMYYCARALLRIPLVRRLVMEVRGLTKRNLVQNSSVNAVSINSVNAGILSFSSSWLLTWRAAAVRVSQAILLRVALLTLVRKVSFKSESFQDAIFKAQEFGMKSEHA